MLLLHTSNYIMLGQKSHQGVKLVKTRRIPELEDENWTKNLNARCPDLNAQRTFHTNFEALLGIQIELKIARWKSCGVYFLEQLEFLNLEFICPSKN